MKLYLIKKTMRNVQNFSVTLIDFFARLPRKTKAVKLPKSPERANIELTEQQVFI